MNTQTPAYLQPWPAHWESKNAYLEALEGDSPVHFYKVQRLVGANKNQVGAALARLVSMGVAERVGSSYKLLEEKAPIEPVSDGGKSPKDAATYTLEQLIAVVRSLCGKNCLAVSDTETQAAVDYVRLFVGAVDDEAKPPEPPHEDEELPTD